MTPAAMLQLLGRWHGVGWLRSLDLALARFVFELDPASPPSLLLATALVAHLEGQGHSALPLRALTAEGLDLPGWPADAEEDLRAMLIDCHADVATWRQDWRALSAIELNPDDDTGASPLVLAGELLYLRRYWRYETRVAAQVRARVAYLPPIGPSTDDLDVPEARALIGRLFGGAATDTEPDWQAVACAVALRGRLTLITGGPGTGKTYTAARLLVLLQSLHAGAIPLRVALAAPTGKAAARLRQSISQALHGLGERVGASLALERWVGQLGPARTLHSMLGTRLGTRRFRHDASNPLDVDLLVVDEASMVHLEMMAQLFEALPARARVVLLGDKDQLASVEAGAVMGELCRSAEAGYRPETAEWIAQVAGQVLPAAARGAGSALAQQTVVLRRSHRFDGPIGRLALAVNSGDASQAWALLHTDASGPVASVAARDASAPLALALGGRAGALGGYRVYLERLARRPPLADAERTVFDEWARAVLRDFDGFRVLCAIRDGAWGVGGLNLAIEQALLEAGLLARHGEWYEGRPVVVTRNDPALGVFNGDIGIVLRAPGADGGLRCWFLEGDELRSVALARLADVETAFAMTVHKSQGSEFEHVVLVLPDEDQAVLTRELIYTGITRARLAFTLVAKQPGLLASATGRLTRRVSGLSPML